MPKESPIPTLAALYLRLTDQSDAAATDAEVTAYTLAAAKVLNRLSRTKARNAGHLRDKLAVFMRETDGDTGGRGSDLLLRGVLADVEGMAA